MDFPTQVLHEAHTKDCEITSLAFSKDNNTLLSRAADDTLKVDPELFPSPRYGRRYCEACESMRKYAKVCKSMCITVTHHKIGEVLGLQPLAVTACFSYQGC